MPRHASEPQGGSFTPAPAGTHLARCVKLIDLGTQHGEYNGEPTIKNQVLVMWELPEELMVIEGVEKPALVSKFYTNSLHEKATLRHDLQNWRGKPFTQEELNSFDLENILGAPCMLSVIHNENGKAKVASVAKLMKGMICPEQVNPSVSFWLEEWDSIRFAELSPGLQAIIEKSDEYKAMFGENVATPSPKARETIDQLKDDIPF